MITIKELCELEDKLNRAISEANKAWAHLDIFLNTNKDLEPNAIEFKNTKDGSYFRVYGYDVDTVKPTLMNTIKLALGDYATRLANEAMSIYSEYHMAIAGLAIEPISVESIPTTYEDWCDSGKKPR